jgi:hypothetical protein
VRSDRFVSACRTRRRRCGDQEFDHGSSRLHRPGDCRRSVHVVDDNNDDQRYEGVDDQVRGDPLPQGTAGVERVAGAAGMRRRARVGDGVVLPHSESDGRLPWGPETLHLLQRSLVLVGFSRYRVVLPGLRQAPPTQDENHAHVAAIERQSAIPAPRCFVSLNLKPEQDVDEGDELDPYGWGGTA